MKPDKPNANELVEAIRTAITPPRPPASEGWQSMQELRENCSEDGTPLSESVIRRKLKILGTKVEKRLWLGRLMFYRIHKNGKP